MPPRPKGTIEAPIDRHPHARDKMAVRDQRAARPSPIGRCWSAIPAASKKPVASLIECRLETGRTHQIRVHLAHIGHPVIGDATYGPGFRTKAALLSEPAQAALEGLGQAGPACLSPGLRTPRLTPIAGNSARNCRPISPVCVMAWQFNKRDFECRSGEKVKLNQTLGLRQRVTAR